MPGTPVARVVADDRLTIAMELQHCCSGCILCVPSLCAPLQCISPVVSRPTVRPPAVSATDLFQLSAQQFVSHDVTSVPSVQCSHNQLKTHLFTKSFPGVVVK